MNWTPNNIFDYQNNLVPCKDGVAQARLICCGVTGEDGWKVTRSQGGVVMEAHKALDVWSACRIMNDWEAVPTVRLHA